MSWSETGEEAVRKYKKGDEVEAIVLGIDVEKERISLGIKQLEGDPFSNFVAMNDKGATVDGVVKSVDAKGAVVQLSAEVEGYLRASGIITNPVEDARNVLKKGDKVNAMIIDIDRKSRHQPVDQNQEVRPPNRNPSVVWRFVGFSLGCHQDDEPRHICRKFKLLPPPPFARGSVGSVV